MDRLATSLGQKILRRCNSHADSMTPCTSEKNQDIILMASILHSLSRLLPPSRLFELVHAPQNTFRLQSKLTPLLRTSWQRNARARLRLMLIIYRYRLNVNASVFGKGFRWTPTWTHATASRKYPMLLKAVTTSL